MIPHTTDVLVIGGGPAGATAAAILAKQGIATTVLEREAFPRYHIGESLLASLLPILELTGVLDKVRKYGFVRKPGGYFDWGDEKWSFVFDELKGIPTHSYQVLRSEFDQLVLDHAAERGADVHQRVRVLKVNFDGDRAVSADYHDRGADVSGTIGFKYVIDASGRTGLIGNDHLKARRYHHSFKNLAVWSYWKGADFDGCGLEGSTRLFSIDAGWFWFIPLHNDTVSVGLVINRDRLKAEQGGRSLEAVYEEMLAGHPEASKILERATRGEMCVETDYSYTSDRFCGPGYFMCGDAACFLDPLLSTGVHLAMMSAMVASAAVTSLVRGEVTEARAANFFEASYRRAYLRFLMLVSAFYDLKRGKTEYFREAERLTPRDYDEHDLKKAFINVVAGTADVDDLRDGRYSQVVTQRFADRLRENIGIHHQAAIDPSERRIQDNARFFDAINGLYVLAQAEAIDGLYVATAPEVRLAEVT